MMQPSLKQLTLPVKGCYYYSADEAAVRGQLFSGQLLKLVAEPQNPYDVYAVQIWLADVSALMLGYIPRQQAPWVQFLTRNHLLADAEITTCYRQFSRWTIDCRLRYHANWRLKFRYWLSRMFSR